MEPVQYPDTVSIYDNMGIEAARHNSGRGGAWRVWVLAQGLVSHEKCEHSFGICKADVTKVRRDNLRARALDDLGINPRTWERWLSDARAWGFVTDVQKADGTWWLILASTAKVAIELGCKDVGRKVSMPVERLVKKGWQAHVFAAWRHKKRISQPMIKRITGVSIRTQVHRNMQANPNRTKNIVFMDTHFNGMSVHDVREITGYNSAHIRDGQVARYLPDDCETPGVTVVAKGRKRKINQEIKSANRSGALQLERALTNDEHIPVRIFAETKRQQNHMTKLILQDRYPAREVFFKTDTTNHRAVVWQGLFT